VLIAVVIGSPIAWFMISKYLQNFAYRIDMQWWVFAAAALMAIVIAFITVSYQAIKAAIANPVESLRSE
jgi:putative ABC transport system permease protein